MGENAAAVRNDLAELAAGLQLTADDVRRITLYAQGFLGAAAKRGGVTGMLRRVSAVQLDTISVLARSHELVAYARLGPVGRAAVERAYWPSGTSTTFEYWAHAACILPIADWPYYAWRRRSIAARGQRWHKVSEAACERLIPAWADPAALAWLNAGGRGTHRTTLLSPFDSLVWDRKRTLRMFGYRHLFEPYVPKEKRERGYFTMPLLAGGQIVGWVDPGRAGQTLIAKNLFLEKPSSVIPMARALTEAAQWVGCSSVAIERA